VGMASEVTGSQAPFGAPKETAEVTDHKTRFLATIETIVEGAKKLREFCPQEEEMFFSTSIQGVRLTCSQSCLEMAHKIWAETAPNPWGPRSMLGLGQCPPGAVAAGGITREMLEQMKKRQAGLRETATAGPVPEAEGGKEDDGSA